MTRAEPRRGVVIVPVIVCLLVVAAIAAGLLRMGLSARQLIDLEARRLQADWLADSALDRAGARLARQPDYLGETWTIPAADLSGAGSATVVIAVETPRDRPNRRLVRVRADYPSGTPRSARRSKTAEMDLESQSPEPTKPEAQPTTERGPGGPGDAS